VKNLAMGDGGALVVNNRNWAQRARRLRWLGIDKSTHVRAAGAYSWDYDVPEIGHKCHTNDINAAIGIVQLARLDVMNARRREIARRYTIELPSIVKPIWSDSGNQRRQSCHLYPVIVPEREAIRLHLAARGISTGVHYRPINTYSCYGAQMRRCPVAEALFGGLLSLPMHPNLSDDDVSRVVREIREFYA